LANLKYEKEITALLVIDPYNDFISEGGKFWDHLKTVTGLIAHTRLEATVRYAAELGKGCLINQ
jgi:ureidoacrylate peracid hydrolase